MNRSFVLIAGNIVTLDQPERLNSGASRSNEYSHYTIRNAVKVAVIGAGAAGLVSARELVREGHEVRVFEKSLRVGGTWVHDHHVEDDPLGIHPSNVIHSSLYDSLRTNLPRDLMAFMDYTFDSTGGGDDDWKRYPHHTCVLKYLESFSRDFNIQPLIEFDTLVTTLKPVEQNRWRLITASGIDECFDAISVCNGHYSLPHVPELNGAGHFKGSFLHSHNYRNPDPFTDQSVAVLGAASSGADISREVATRARKVIWCGELFQSPVDPPEEGLAKYSLPIEFNTKGELVFEDSPPIAIDSFIYCTGYQYNFPFIDPSIVNVAGNQVGPLHMDIVHPNLPTLGFIGLPYMVIPFPLFEMQARWFARLLGDIHRLPTEAGMMKDLKERHSDLANDELKGRHLHKLGDNQFNYINDLALQCGADLLPPWFELLAKEAQQARLTDPENFRSKPLRHSGTTAV